MDAWLTTTWALTALAAGTRVAGVVVAAPLLGWRVVPGRLRAFVAVVLTVAVMGRLSQALAPPPDGASLVLALAGELAVGLVLGYAARMLFVAGQLAAGQIGWQMGVSLGELYSGESQDSQQPVDRLFWVLTLGAFLTIGGHRAMIGGLMTSFDHLPLLGFVPGRGLTDLLAALLSMAFVLGVQLAAPVLVALLLTTVALGLVQRAVPQMHVLSVGLPVRVLVGLLALAASVGITALLVAQGWGDLWRLVGGRLAGGH